MRVTGKPAAMRSIECAISVLPSIVEYCLGLLDPNRVPLPAAGGIAKYRATSGRAGRGHLLLWQEVRRRRMSAVRRANVVDDDVGELFRNAVAFQRHRLVAVDEYGRDGHFAAARQADADVGHLRLARPVDDATHHSDSHVLDAGVL